MPRPMTTYRSGIKTVKVQRWLTCPECQAEHMRARTFVGPLADDDAKAWAPDPRCSKHLRAAMRTEVGL